MNELRFGTVVEEWLGREHVVGLLVAKTQNPAGYNGWRVLWINGWTDTKPGYATGDTVIWMIDFPEPWVIHNE